MRHQQANMILGGVFLFVLVFQPVAEGSVAVSQAASVSKAADQQPNLDMSQLAKLDIDPVLMQFIGNVVTQVVEAKNAAISAELAQVKNVTQVLQVENKAVRAELAQVKKDKNALENKTQVIQAELSMEKKRNDMLQVEVYRFSNNTSTRLDQCEATSNPFIREMEHRRLQQAAQCQGSGIQTMLTTCCPDGGGSGGHRRGLQSGHGCAAFPDTCSTACATVFTEFYEGCREDMIAAMPAAEQAQFDSFYGACTEAEQAAAAMMDGASPAMIFHVLVVSDAAANQDAMFGGGMTPSPPLGPLEPVPTPAPALAPASDGAVVAQEFRRVCTTANLATCVPDCNGGFLPVVVELLVVFLLCGHIVDAHTDATLDVSAQR